MNFEQNISGVYKVPFPPLPGGNIESSCWGRKSSGEGKGKGMEGKGERGKGREMGSDREENRKGRGRLREE